MYRSPPERPSPGGLKNDSIDWTVNNNVSPNEADVTAWSGVVESADCQAARWGSDDAEVGEAVAAPVVVLDACSGAFELRALRAGPARVALCVGPASGADNGVVEVAGLEQVVDVGDDFAGTGLFSPVTLHTGRLSPTTPGPGVGEAQSCAVVPGCAGPDR